MNELAIALGIGAGVVLYQGHLPNDRPFYTLPPSTMSAIGVKTTWPTIPYIAVCYGTKADLATRVAQMVAAACTNPQFVREDYVGNCTIDAPVRVTYRCTSVNKAVSVPQKPFGTAYDVKSYYNSTAFYRSAADAIRRGDE